MFEEIKQTLRDFRVPFDVWFHENDLYESGATDRALARLRELGNIYEQDGAVWLRTEKFGDDKDRVIVKSDGHGAYISGDAAYYLDKRERGFDRCIILLGADHHGYVGRMMALCAAFGDEPGVNLEIIIGQMVNLLSHGSVVRMGKRTGNIITLLDLVEAIGIDAARYALVRNSLETNLDIDLDLWTKATSDNPVFYVQYAHARVSSILRNAADLGPRARLPPGAAHPREGGRAAARARRLPAGGRRPPTTLREPHRVARYLEDTAASYHRFYDSCRVLPMGDEEPVRPAPRPAAAGRGHADRPGQRARAARGLRPRAHVTAGCHAHPRSRLGARRRCAARAEPGCASRATPTRWCRRLWSTTAHKVDGDLVVGGVSLPELVADVNTPAYVLDEADFRSRARAFREAFAAYDVFYAGKAFLCTTVARWVAEEGLCLDVCSDGELTVALRAGFDPARIGYHGNTKTEPELRRAVAEGVGRIIVDSFDEIERLERVTASLGRDPAGDGAGDRRASRPTPTSTSPPPTRTRSSASRSPPATPSRRYAGWSPPRASSCSACTPTSAARSSTPRASRWPPGGCSRCTRRSPPRLGVTMPELDLGGGFGIAYTTQDDPSDPAQLAIEMSKIVEHECRALGDRASRGCRSSPAARSSARRCAPSTPSAPSSGSSSTGERCAPTSASTAG